MSDVPQNRAPHGINPELPPPGAGPPHNGFDVVGEASAIDDPPAFIKPLHRATGGNREPCMPIPDKSIRNKQFASAFVFAASADRPADVDFFARRDCVIVFRGPCVNGAGRGIILLAHNIRFRRVRRLKNADDLNAAHNRVAPSGSEARLRIGRESRA